MTPTAGKFIGPHPGSAQPPTVHSPHEPDGQVFTDAQLLAGSVDDPDLFSVVYDRHAPALYRFAARRLGPELGQDAVADAVLAAFRVRHRYDPQYRDARAWLLGILTREISEHRRSERARYRALTRVPLEHAHTSEDTAARVVEQVTAQTVRAPLAAALGTLAARDRDVLLLVAWADLSYQEVAHALQIPIGTVRSRLNRARRQLRAALPDLHLSLDDKDLT